MSAGNTGEKASAEAELKGFTVVKSTDNTLLFDFDDPVAYNEFRETWEQRINEHFGVTSFEMWHSKSSTIGNPRRHVKLTIEKPLPLYARLAIQAACGSDPKREFLGVVYHHSGDRDACLLFRPPPWPEGERL